jgi:hypothetical protein
MKIIRFYFVLSALCLFTISVQAQTLGGAGSIGGDISVIGAVDNSLCGGKTQRTTTSFAPTNINAPDCDAAEDSLKQKIQDNPAAWGGISCPTADCRGLGGCLLEITDLQDIDKSYSGTSCLIEPEDDGDIVIKWKCSPCGDPIAIIGIEILEGGVRGIDGVDAGGRREGLEQEQVQLYPVPCKNLLTLDLNAGIELDDLQAEIYNVQGQRVFVKSYGDQPDGAIISSISVESLDAGQYFLLLSSTNGWAARAHFVVAE